jgi:hypothetical protein
VLASGRPGDAGAGALPINADAAVMAATLTQGPEPGLRAGAGPRGLSGPGQGSATVNGVALGERDGAAIRDEAELTIAATRIRSW